MTFTLPAGTLSQGTHTLSLAAGGFTSVQGAPIPAFTSTFVYDTAAPTVTSFNAPAVTLPSSSYTFTVTYADNFIVDASTFGSNNIQVTGPNGFSQLATYVSTNLPGNGTPRTVTYSLMPPGGTWSTSGNGTYTATLGIFQIRDLASNYTQGSALCTIAVTIAPAVPSAGPCRRHRLGDFQ